MRPALRSRLDRSLAHVKRPARALRLAAERAQLEAEQGSPITTPQQEVLLKRRRRRVVDLKSLPGVLRESARIYRDLVDRTITLETGEVLSRAIARHHEILKTLKQESQILELMQQLREVRGAPLIGWDVDETE
jgi:hypothetical protein